MLNAFRQSLSPLVDLSDQAWREIEARAVPVEFGRGDVLLRVGERSGRIVWLHSGGVRYYALRDGNEHVTGFDFEGAFAGDYGDFFEGRPASHTAEAIEAVEGLAITSADYRALVELAPGLSALKAVAADRLVEGLRTRASESQQIPAEERYRRLLDRSPHVILRVPQYMVASYLGVTPEALSRIRRRLR
ncbi:Crp/Fnr family transcriptional regulator [Rubrivirga sp.]|uniref:Crp/Fnr family transcriptional regulator n=1 Tax=Rubrivirga sp. TaxID=1885344 RepID=UPI003C7183EF